jgi:adenine-specific DNA-methyltransferase
MIKYLGSKRVLLPRIVEVVRAMGPKVRTVVDLFSGTSRVGHALKREGYRVIANDHNAYAATLARCYVQADDDLAARATEALREMAALPPAPGYFTETFCERSRFFRPENGARVDAMREHIELAGYDAELKAVLLVALMEAADRVDSTTGVQMAYLKKWAPRALNDVRLRLPELLPRPVRGKCEASQSDALQAAAAHAGDAAYLDPPYNQHSYLGNYHVWESLVRWDKPATYGIACKREDVRNRQSRFNSRRGCGESLATVIANVRAPNLIVSFNNEGFVSLDDLRDMLAPRGHLLTLAFDFKRYVGAQIGIYNPSGVKVGTVGRLRNVEYMVIATRDRPSRELKALARVYAPETALKPSRPLQPTYAHALAS